MKAKALKPVFYFLVFTLSLFVFSRPAAAYPTQYQTGTTIHDQTKAYQGYTIFMNLAGSELIMIDMDGNKVNTWAPADYRIQYYGEPLDNGNILCMAIRNDHPVGGVLGVLELDWNSNPVWAYFHPGDLKAHHGFQRLDNGNTLILMNEIVEAPSVSPGTILDDYIIEVNQAGRIVWEWRALDHIDEYEFSAEALALIHAQGEAPGDNDWLHANSIQSLPDSTLGQADSRFKAGNIAVSFRAANLLIVIDKSTGAVVWKSGPDNALTIAQHNLHMIDPALSGGGDFMVFDNGSAAGYPLVSRAWSRVVQFNPAAMETTWVYTADKSQRPQWTFFSWIISGAQRLPNGNTMICEGVTGRLFEVTADHEIVWEYINPDYLYAGDTWKFYSNWAYRAVRAPLSWTPAAR